jgi:hypothetical protein
MADPIKPGWQTTEFWTTMVVQGISLAVIVGLVNSSESATLTDSLTKMVTAIFSLLVSSSTVLNYIKARVTVKTR